MYSQKFRALGAAALLPLVAATMTYVVQTSTPGLQAAQAQDVTAPLTPWGEPDLQGIWQALITTAFGLTVAIPMLVAYKYLQGRNDRLIVDMEEDAMGLVDLLEDASRRDGPHKGASKDDAGEEKA